jgi:hypothetical protein
MRGLEKKIPGFPISIDRRSDGSITEFFLGDRIVAVFSGICGALRAWSGMLSAL